MVVLPLLSCEHYHHIKCHWMSLNFEIYVANRVYQTHPMVINVMKCSPPLKGGEQKCTCTSKQALHLQIFYILQWKILIGQSVSFSQVKEQTTYQGN